MTDRFIRMKELVKITGLCQRTIYNRMDAGTFPARVRIGDNAVAWRESDLIARIESANTSRHRIPTNQMHDMNHRRVRRLGRHCVLLRHAQPSK